MPIRNCLVCLPICQAGGQQHGRGGAQDPTRYIRREAAIAPFDKTRTHQRKNILAKNLNVNLSRSGTSGLWYQTIQKHISGFWQCTTYLFIYFWKILFGVGWFQEENIHSKSETVCGVCFSVTKNLRKKCVNLNIKILLQKCVNQ